MKDGELVGCCEKKDYQYWDNRNSNVNIISWRLEL